MNDFEKAYIANPAARTFYLDYTSVPDIEQKLKPYLLPFDFYHVFYTGETVDDDGRGFQCHNVNAQTAPSRIATVLGQAAERDPEHQQVVITNNPVCAGIRQNHPRAVVYPLLQYMREMDMIGQPGQYSPYLFPAQIKPQMIVPKKSMPVDRAVWEHLQHVTLTGQVWRKEYLPPVGVSLYTNVLVTGITEYLFYKKFGFEGYDIIPYLRVNSGVQR